MTEKELVSLPIGTWVMVEDQLSVVAQRIGVPVRKAVMAGVEAWGEKDKDAFLINDDDPDDPGGILVEDAKTISLPTRELIDRWAAGREGAINQAIRDALEKQLREQPQAVRNKSEGR